MIMNDGALTIATEAARLAAILPVPILQSLAEKLCFCGAADWTSMRQQVVRAIPHAHYRSVVGQFLERWASQAAAVTPQEASLALLTASHMVQASRDGQGIELVWTGPPTDVVPLRRTEQAILQVIESAIQSVLVVSYAVYKIPRIGDALIRAADRGVELTVVLETPDRQAGRNAYDTLKALGALVASRSKVYLWPHEQRVKDPTGKQGILHVKCVAADGEWLFLSSANLTEYAFSLNMELGLLIQGGKVPLDVASHFDSLISKGILVSV
jgi:phosphatidylserine/phosphatidylglycerophosphate/cardiolipin synthase-like enzyme